MLLFIWAPAFEFLKLAAGTFSKGVNRAEALKRWHSWLFLVFWGKMNSQQICATVHKRVKSYTALHKK